LINFASVLFLRELSRDLKDSREALTMRKSRGRNGLRVLDRIQSFFDRSLGTPAAASELKSRADNLGLYKHECARFVAPSWKAVSGQPSHLA
jgi:hypothetical protein